MKGRSYWKSVKSTIWESDILVIVLDARFIHETENEEIMTKIRQQGKPYLYAITKADLVDNIDKSTIPKPYVMLST